jgi:hypothetical protein
MKLLTILLIGFSFSVVARDDKDAQKDKVKGKVKVVTEREYGVKRMFFVTGKELDNKIIYKYDGNGNETEAASYLRKGNMDYKITSKYDDKNRLTESLLYNSEVVPEVPDTRSVFKYDENGNQTEMDDYNPNGTLIKKHVFRYDEKGNQVEFISYNQDNTVEYKAVNKFDLSGNRTEEAYYNGKDSLEFKIVFKYDHQGLETEQDYYGAANNLTFELTYKYEDIDPQGNWLKQTIYEDGNKEATNKRAIEYY